MKRLFVFLTVATLTLGVAATATASTIQWNLFDVKFTTGNPTVDTATATGFFSIDSGTLAVVNFDIVVSGGTVPLTSGGLANANHHYVLGPDQVMQNVAHTSFYFCAANPNCFTPAATAYSLTLALSSAITAGPGTISLTNATLDCPRCGVLGVTDAAITTNAVPEPASMLLFATGLAAGAARLRRRRK